MKIKRYFRNRKKWEINLLQAQIDLSQQIRTLSVARSETKDKINNKIDEILLTKRGK